MRSKRRHIVHARLLFTFLFFGSVGSFVLGQEMARTFAAVPAYAAQSLMFSGAGIIASLATPLQASGAIGQPAPTKKVVKSSSKPSKPSPSKRPSAKPTPAPQQAPAQPAPIVLQGIPIATTPTTAPCADASCASNVKPAPAVLPPSGGAVGSSSGAPGLNCSPTGLVSVPAPPALTIAPARCAGPGPTQKSPPAETPKPAAPGVTLAPASPMAPQTVKPAPVIAPAQTVDVALAPVVAPTQTPAAPACTPPATAPATDPTPSSTGVCADACSGAPAPIVSPVSTTSATPQDQQPNP
jgi:hypothetical protein